MVTNERENENVETPEPADAEAPEAEAPETAAADAAESGDGPADADVRLAELEAQVAELRDQLTLRPVEGPHLRHVPRVAEPVLLDRVRVQDRVGVHVVGRTGAELQAAAASAAARQAGRRVAQLALRDLTDPGQAVLGLQVRAVPVELEELALQVAEEREVLRGGGVKLAEALHLHGDTNDRMESRAACAEKRKPVFKGWKDPQDRFRMPKLSDFQD